MIVDDFQKQIENNKSCFTDDELGLFQDSVRCFHAAIYRPAYILAYQGMMIYFRRMIQNAKMPTGFDPTKWKVMQLNLAKDKDWEEEVNNAIMKAFLKGLWQFCSYLFVPQWGRSQRVIEKD